MDKKNCCSNKRIDSCMILIPLYSEIFALCFVPGCFRVSQFIVYANLNKICILLLCEKGKMLKKKKKKRTVLNRPMKGIVVMGEEKHSMIL